MERAQLTLEPSFNIAILNERVSWFMLLAEVDLRTSNTEICAFRITNESYDGIFFSVIRAHIGIPDNFILSIV